MSVTISRRLICVRLLTPVAVCLAAACSDSTQPVRPVVPKVDTTTVRPTQPAAPPPPAPAAPQGPATAYEGPLNLYDAYASYHGGSMSSRYVLYQDSTFELQFSSPRFGAFAYPGRYTRAGSLLQFDFGGAWKATGTLSGDTITVNYNLNMGLSDFLDGAYVHKS